MSFFMCSKIRTCNVHKNDVNCFYLWAKLPDLKWTKESTQFGINGAHVACESACGPESAEYFWRMNHFYKVLFQHFMQLLVTGPIETIGLRWTVNSNNTKHCGCKRTVHKSLHTATNAGLKSESADGHGLKSRKSAHLCCWAIVRGRWA